MEYQVINTLQDGEQVASTYAEVYFHDDYCDNKRPIPESDDNVQAKSKIYFEEEETTDEDWVSPSDLLIGIVDLKPPFTSKITRGKAHEGILRIGDGILAAERTKFEKYLSGLISENESAWNDILKFEKAAVIGKVKEIYANIFQDKSQIMAHEIALFFEKTLQMIEKNIKTQVEDILISTHASIISKMNTDIKQKLQIEKIKLKKILKKRYESEKAKIRNYYSILLNNEKFRSQKLINRTILERNDAVKAFIRQIEAENTSSTMYVMCTERKKCKIKQFILENYQSDELKEKYQNLKEKKAVVNMFKEREVHIFQINTEWEEKIKKIVQLFLKFISFSLKLLPQQSSFLLNFEKMVLLQLNDIQKTPHKKSSILTDEEKFANTFKFEETEEKEEECTKEPFVLTGGYISGTPSTEYGSRETIPDDVDLPAVRLQRQFVYAKCHHYEEIKAKLEAERCRCLDQATELPEPKRPPEPKPSSSKPKPIETILKTEVPISKSFENLLIYDIHRHDDCPARNCQQWVDSLSFPDLNAYLDFDDEKYGRILTILGRLSDKSVTPDFIDPKKIVYQELPFSATKEPYHHVETQYSSQEDLYVPDITCPCFNDFLPEKLSSHYRIKETPSRIIADNMVKRKISLRRLLQQNPELIKTLTDESFDFVI